MREKLNLLIKQANETFELFAKIALSILSASIISIFIAILSFNFFSGFISFVISSIVFIFIHLYRKK